MASCSLSCTMQAKNEWLACYIVHYMADIKAIYDSSCGLACYLASLLVSVSLFCVFLFISTTVYKSMS